MCLPISPSEQSRSCGNAICGRSRITMLLMNERSQLRNMGTRSTISEWRNKDQHRHQIRTETESAKSIESV